MNSLLSSSSSPHSTMNSTNASSSNPSKKIKLTIISPRQLVVNISSDEDITTTPSPTTTSSSLTPPNAPSKTTSTNQTSSSQENTSSFHSKLQISPPSSHEPTSPHHLNPFIDNISDVPPRPLNPQPLQISKTTKEKVKSLALKAKFTREQTSNNSDSRGGSGEEEDDDEDEEFNLMARNFRKFFRKGNQLRRGNRFSNGGNMFGKGFGNRFGNKGVRSSGRKHVCYNCGEEGHIIDDCPKPKENKAFVVRAWSDSEDDDEPQKDATCLMEIDSQEVHPKPSTSNSNVNLHELQKENEELLKFHNDFAKTFEKLLKEKCSLKS
ncbi:retrovirus-related pol polyprotein from transposon TNT 1-94 [Tanacetum coccineum]